jgi:tripartite-type tricarboxylate transporter receptor subunit TctC
MTQIDAGRLRPLAVASRRRQPALRGVPTMIEAGYKDVEATAWFGVMAPPKTPEETMGQLIAQFKAALAAPELRSTLAALGLYPSAICGDDFAVHLKRQYDSYARAVRQANIKAE